MVRRDEVLGLLPMLIDVDSVRPLNQGGGIRRLLRSLAESPGFNLDDALSLIGGYAPFATHRRIQRILRSIPKLTQRGPA